MLMVHTKLGHSSIAGIGLFATEFIPKGAVIWRFKEGFDQLLTQEQVDDLPPVAQKEIAIHTYFSKDLERYVLMADAACFFNHSESPNTGTVPDDAGHPEGMTIALQDIESGEELTTNYREYDEQAELKLAMQ
ncbi:SET domain-containing protein [Candidatus Woesebacteria bacterium]|nr:SET domain-containing protein [Candidatus Woesebacteria bacterium]